MRVGQRVLFEMRGGGEVRDLFYSFESQGYNSTDVSIFSGHLLEGRRIISWAYAKRPDKVVWAVLDDGSAVGLSYIPEQQISAWHRHTFAGKAISVTSVNEQGRDVPYFIVQDSDGVNTIQRLFARDDSSPEKGRFLDEARLFDASFLGDFKLIPHATGYFVKKVAADGTESFVNSGQFVIGDGFISGDTTIRITRVNPAQPGESGTVSASVVGPVANGALYKMALGTVIAKSGAARPLRFLTDGYDSGEANVSNGENPLADIGTVVLFGKSIIADAETLPIKSVGEGLITRALTSVNQAQIEGYRTAAFYAKAGRLPAGDSVEGMYESRPEIAPDPSLPIPLHDGSIDVTFDGEWSSNPAVAIRHIKPFACRIIGLTIYGQIPSGRGSEI